MLSERDCEQVVGNLIERGFDRVTADDVRTFERWGGLPESSVTADYDLRLELAMMEELDAITVPL